MTPVDQQILEDGRGDCLRACVCSVLDLDPDEVPNFADFGFMDAVDKWLNDMGKAFLRISLPKETNVNAFYFWTPGPMLVWGTSPRPRLDGGTKQHMVVAKPKGYGLEIVHDPHPDRTGLLDFQGFGWIVSVQ